MEKEMKLHFIADFHSEEDIKELERRMNETNLFTVISYEFKADYRGKEVLFDAICKYKEENKNDIIRLTHHGEEFYDGTKLENVSIQIQIDGKWY